MRKFESAAFMSQEHQLVADCALNIIQSGELYGLRHEFEEWMAERVTRQNLTIEQAVFMGLGALSWASR